MIACKDVVPEGIRELEVTAQGMPEVVLDHIPLWGSFLKFRSGFDKHACLHPVRLMPGINTQLAGNKGSDIDFIIAH